jgi:hypothetical protein
LPADLSDDMPWSVDVEFSFFLSSFFIYFFFFFVFIFIILIRCSLFFGVFYASATGRSQMRNLKLIPKGEKNIYFFSNDVSISIFFIPGK